MDEITKEEFADWQKHPVTMKFFKAVLSQREEGLHELAYGRFSEEQGKQNIAIGKINALTTILDMKYEDATNE